MVGKINILSLNVRGMRDLQKRRKIFKYCRNKNADIILLQETHGCNKSNTLWLSSWGSTGIFANGLTNSRGVATLFCKKMKIDEIIRDVNGRYLILTVDMNEEKICICNIYAPNTDSPEFFRDVLQKIRDMQCAHNIIGGDFNVVLDNKLDRSSNLKLNMNASETILDAINTGEWVDIWREENGDKKSFTWHRQKPFSWSRIDYYLVSKGLRNMISETKIEPCCISDHCAVVMSLEVEPLKRGPGMWKLNVNTLNDEKVCEVVANHINHITKTYKEMSPFDVWELIKMESARILRDEGKRKTKNKKTTRFRVNVIKGMVKRKIWLTHQIMRIQNKR